ncbi:hypothetical protein [Verrucomicrobium spinosum]|uniref:hypothetical protein n=1 Tax=Verrucomicrobium spinosum TaxID=2736 RepID=UPI00094611D0|nr:hypothetical protein [Verrucomicrobium spinosum]
MAPRIPSLLALLFLASGLTAPIAHGKDSDKAAPQAENEAPTPEDARFFNLIREAQGLHATQKNFDALQKLDEAELLQPSSPLIPNVRGSIFTAMRDIPKARENFEKARSLSPEAFEPKFNLVELDYVEGKYPEAEAGFSKLLTDYPKLKLEVRHLSQFKVLVCRLKQGDVSGAQEIAKNFTFMDDTPAYYYSKAAFAYQEGKKGEGNEWLGRAAGIYKQPILVPYIDSLMEAKWVESLGVTESLPSPSLSVAARTGRSVCSTDPFVGTTPCLARMGVYCLSCRSI